MVQENDNSTDSSLDKTAGNREQGKSHIMYPYEK